MDYQANKVDKTFDKVVAELDRYSKVFRKGGQLERAVAEINGDIAWFNDIRSKLDDLIDTVNDAHMYAMADHADMGESVTEAVAKIACVKCDEVSTAAAWKKNDGFCPKCKTSSQGVAESKAVKGKKLTEGVLDGDDEDGFMARSQLYFLAKDAISLHGMISDRDNLEPWVQSKITTAANDIEAVRRYTEYNQQQADRQLPVPAEEPAPGMEMEEGWETLPAYDKEKYQERPGLEGPFQTRAGKVVYYDPKQGAYYDPTSDTYLSYDEWKALDMPDTPLRNEAVSEGKGKPDFLDLDKDGNKKEPMKKAAKDAKKVEEGMDFDDKRDGDLKQIAADMFSHAKKAAAKKVK